MRSRVAESSSVLLKHSVLQADLFRVFCSASISEVVFSSSRYSSYQDMVVRFELKTQI